jgi:hypothetical protein
MASHFKLPRGSYVPEIEIRGELVAPTDTKAHPAESVEALAHAAVDASEKSQPSPSHRRRLMGIVMIGAACLAAQDFELLLEFRTLAGIPGPRIWSPATYCPTMLDAG